MDSFMNYIIKFMVSHCTISVLHLVATFCEVYSSAERWALYDAAPRPAPLWLHKAVLWAGQDAALWPRALALLTQLGPDADDEAWALGARACASGGAWEMALGTSHARNPLRLQESWRRKI